MVAETGRRTKRSMAPGAIPLSKTLGVYGAGPGESRWSGENLVPSDGYSSLFTSGLMREPGSPGSPMMACNPFRPASKRVTPPSMPRRESIPIVSEDSVFSPQPAAILEASLKLSRKSANTKVDEEKEAAPADDLGSSTKPLRISRRSRHRRSSAAAGSATSPHKSPTKDVVQALDGVMKSLAAFSLPGSSRRAQRDTFIPNNQSRWSSSTEGSSITADSSCRPRKSGESIRSRMTTRSIKSVRSKRSLRSLRFGANRKSEDVEYAFPNWDADAPPVPPPPVQVPQTPGKGKRAMMGLARKLGLTPKKKKKQSPPPVPSMPSPPPPPPALPVSMPITSPDLGLPLPLPRTPSSRSLPRKGSFSTLRSLTKKVSSGTLRSFKGENAAVPPVPTGTTGVSGCIPTTPRRMPKSSIGPPQYVAQTSPGKFMRELPRRAPTTPKQDADENDGEVITFGSPADTAPDLTVDRSADISGVSAATTAIMTPDTSFQPDEHSTPTSTRAFHTPLTAKSAAVKPKRLLNLLPKQQQRNLGLSPVHTGRKLTQSASIPNLRGGLPTPGGDDFPAMLSRPLGTLANENTTPPAASRPFRGKSVFTLKTSKSQEWYTSRPTADGPFGGRVNDTAQPLLDVSIRRRPVPDFSAPPTHHPHSAPGSPGSGARTSQASEPSMLGTLESGEEGWEFQQFLRDYEDPEVCVGIALVR